MEFAATTRGPTRTITNLNGEDIKRMAILAVFVVVASIVAIAVSIVIYSQDSSTKHGRDDHTLGLSPSSSPPSLHPIIKIACADTLYPSLCLTTLSYLAVSDLNATTLHRILEFVINRTAEQVVTAQFNVSSLFTSQDLNSQGKNALRDCAVMLDQTLYELRQAIDDLRSFPVPIGYVHHSYGNLKTLLSAAMTNENTCIDGFSDLEESDSEGQKGPKLYLQNLLTPISRMISNCLALIRYMEKEGLNNPPTVINTMPEDGFSAWMTTGDRRKMIGEAARIRANAIVSCRGRGKYRTIGEAIMMAPNASTRRYVIKIKAGIYKENVEIPREKVNIMLVGDGMNSTVITGSKNFVDGFSTFTSATLTVVGDKFLARELAVVNTAGPGKHQAVALKVTSNAAFYRCNISSYQDTLYAHSLRQFYRECTIQGTVDFIFGNAAAVFQNCLILVRKPDLGQKNMITAQGREDPNQNTGISLQNCTIVAAPGFAGAERGGFSTFLGRPWRNYSRTIVMKSYLGDLIHPQGWSEWNEYSNLDTVEYIEYMNFGPGSDTRKRVRWAGYRKNCSEDMARQFTVGAFLHGADEWLESTGFPLFYGS